MELNVYLASSRVQQVDREAAPAAGEFDYDDVFSPVTPIAAAAEELAPLSPVTPPSPTLAPTDTVASKHGAMPTPPPPPANPEAEGSSVITVSCPTAAMEGELLANTLHRVEERGRILTHFVFGGWLWVRLASEKQATRCVSRLSGVRVCSGRFLLEARQTAPSAWPPCFGLGGATAPPAPKPTAGRRRHKGGIRHHQTGRG